MRSALRIILVLLISINIYGNNQVDSLDIYYQNNDVKHALRIIESMDFTSLDTEELFETYQKAIEISIIAKSFDKAIKYYDFAAEIDDLSNRQQAILDLSKAKILLKMGNLKEAGPYLNKVETYIKSFNPDSSFLMKYNLARVHYYDESGRYKEAMQYATELLKYMDRMQNPEAQASLCVSVGEIFRNNNLGEKALFYYQKAEDIALEHNYIGLLGKIYNNQSIIYAEQGEYEISTKKLKESARLYTEAFGEVSAAPAYHNLGLRNLELGNTDEALDYFKKVLEIGKNNNFSKAEFFGNFGLGLYYSELLQVSNATYHYKKALDIAKKNKIPADIGRTYEQLHLLYDTVGDFQKSLTYFKLYNGLRDSLNMAENKMIIEGLEAKYRLSESERENKSLRLKQTRQRFSFFVAGGVILILLFIMVLFYIGIRSKNRQNQLLSIQKDQIDLKNQELQKLNEAVSAQKSKLEELNFTKDAMFSIISHDLRSPLGSVYTLMNMLENEDFNNDQGKSMVEDLSFEVYHTLFLLNNLMTWAHVNIHDLKASQEIIVLEVMIKDILIQFEKSIKRKNLIIDLNIDQEIELLEDVSMTEFVIKNIISNALKFSNENEKIIIRTERLDDRIQLQIVNKGVEIPSNKLKEIFEPGVTLGKGTKDERGAGLGLAICKTYIKVMDAEISLKSDKGITTVTLLFNSGPY